MTEILRNRIKIGACLRTGEVRVVVPPATPEQLYHRRHDSGFVFANDIRILRRWAPASLDESGVYALLQYGATPAPLTVFKDIHRVPGGHVLTIRLQSQNPALDCCFELTDQCRNDGRSVAPENEVWRLLDRSLEEVPPSAVLYFSGGVDSGLLAARLAALGRTDVTLFNASFGRHDPQARLAAGMAAHLGLRMDQMECRASELAGVLDRLAYDYSFPYSDPSTLPTNLLVHASLPSLTGCAVLDGTGADALFAFGLKFTRWERVRRIPQPVRRAVSGAYHVLGLWRSAHPLAHFSNVVRRSVQMPLTHAAVVAHNALDQIAYAVPPFVQKTIDAAFRDGLHVMSGGLTARDRAAFLDVAHVCGGRVALKTFDPLRIRGIETIFPFLEPDLLRAGFRIGWQDKCSDGVAKSLLKERLAAAVPREMVFRPKRGFSGPYQDYFAAPAMQEFMADTVLSETNPVLSFVDRKVLRAIVERTRKAKPVGTGVYQLLWSTIVLSGWLRQLEASMPPSRDRPELDPGQQAIHSDPHRHRPFEDSIQSEAP